MGLFDFFKKKSSSEKTPIEDGDKTVVKSEDTDDSAPGWEAIDAEFDRLYPDQPNPLHYGTVVKYMFGGPDPLDGISVYDAEIFGILSAMACRSYIQKKAPTQNTVVMGLN